MSKQPAVKAPTSDFSISPFQMHMLTDNSKIVIIGRQTNHRLIFKTYRNYFESAEQVKDLLDELPKNTFLVINETSPNNRLENIIYYYSLQH